VDNANYLICDGRAVYINTDTQLSRMARIGKTELWRVDESYPHSIIIDRENLYAGGNDTFAVFRKISGAKLWSAPVVGKVYGLAISDDSLLVATDEGRVYCYRSAP
jgi:outer membrane protein assembly factor BamB